MRKVATPEMLSYFSNPMSPSDDVGKQKYDHRRYREMYHQMDMHHEKSENVHFADSPGEHIADRYAMEETRSTNDTSVTLGDFLSRPVQIDTFLWAVGSNFDFVLDPWALFLQNKRVSNRICNYKMLRGKLCVKVVINGNGFYYARGIVSYNPAYSKDEFAENNFFEHVTRSQRQKIFLDPTLSEGGVLKLPFFNPTNAIDLTDISSTTFGRLNYFTLNPLKHVNGGTVPLTVTTYAWMEDVSLDGLTTVNMSSLTPQMAMSSEGDEIETANKEGVVSGAMTAAANVAGALATIPAMSSVALPAQTAMKVGADIAKMFGYSRPCVSRTPDLYNPRPYSSLASTTTPDTSAKLTGDSDQTLALGSSIAGVKQEGDPMGFANIAAIESYLTTFNWAEGVGNGTFLFNMRVHPFMFRKDGGDNYWFTPSAVASLPFDTWTGSMKIRFQVVCSSMHKGRLRITYDPNYVDDVSEYNTAYTRIVDIADETDFTICVKPTQIVKYMKRPAMNNGLTEGDCFSTTKYTTTALWGNGVVAVSIVNGLTSVSTSQNDIQVNVYTSFCDDFHVNNPNNDLAGMTYYTPPLVQMDMGIEAVANATSNAEESPNEGHVAEVNKDMDHQPMVYYGEDIRSFRNYIKRYTLHFSLQPTPAPGSDTYLVLYGEPYHRGQIPTLSTNRCGFPFATFVKNCFAGWRGSFRWKIIHNDDEGAVRSSKTYVYRSAQLTSYTFFQGTWNFNDAGNQIYNSSNCGAALISAGVNDILEYELPFYSNKRFAIGRVKDLKDPIEQHSQWASITMRGTTASDFTDGFVSAGEDFEVYGWIGCPSMYFLPTI